MHAGRVVDVGCWTGSFLVAARSRGWAPIGVEPSRWASARARERSLTVYTRELGAAVELLDPEAFRLVVCCDVLEHLVDPGAALDVMHHLLEPGGMLYLTVPDADSRLARALGRHWWAIVPMHEQYFTRHSLRRVLENHGFAVRFVASHPKVFSLRYYAERLDTFLPLRGRLAEVAAERSGFGDRLVAPNLGDRVQVIAERQ